MMKMVGLRSTRGKTVIVAAVVAMLSTVTAMPASADGSQARDAAVEIDTAVGKVPGLAELLDATDATVADGVDVHANGDTAVVYDSGEASVEIPDDPTAGVTLTSSTGSTITVGVPGNPDDAVVALDGSVVYNDAYRDVSIVVQPQIDGGARMITVIDSPSAPDSFDYPVTFDARQSMSLTPDGGAVIIGQTGSVAGSVPPAWAFDADGMVVAADYTLAGTTLTLNIHPTDTAIYPIVADPCFWGWSCAKKIVTGAAKGAASGAVIGCGVGALAGLFIASPPGCVTGATYGSINGAIGGAFWSWW